jgi:hypothetical protein
VLDIADLNEPHLFNIIWLMELLNQQFGMFDRN